MGVATRTLVTEKRNAKVKPSVIAVNAVAAAIDADLTFNDVFTPAVTNAVPIPVLTTVPRLNINVGMGTSVTTEDLLKDIEFLGTIQVVSNGGVDAGILVSFAYDFKD
jgi:hypothetical protein